MKIVGTMMTSCLEFAVLYVQEIPDSVLPDWRMIILTDIFHGFIQSLGTNTVP
jgi:hypothetical protein